MRPERAYLTLLAAVATVALLLAAGLGFAIYFATHDPNTTTADTSPRAAEASLGVGDGLRDRIAAEPMLTVTAADATSGVPALGVLPTIEVPTPDRIGPEGVPTGYPRTPEGAVGQLGEIAVSVLSAMSLDHAQQVEAAWSEAPGSGGTWPVLTLIQDFLAAGHLSDGLPGSASMLVTPVAGQVKGSDGDDWHVTCVLVRMTYTYRDQASLAFGLCERMTWTGGRWVIGAGEHPVPAPSTWPGTDLAVEAGWLVWKDV